MIGAYTASFLPIIFVPLTGLVMPAVVMGLLFNYIQGEG